MSSLIGHEIWILFLSLGFLLFFARGFGELMQRINQPAVLGEMLAGIILGPTILGTLLPEWNHFLFPVIGPRAVMIEGLSGIGIALFLLVVGMEVDLSTVWRQGKTVFYVAAGGLLVPFGISFAAAWALPAVFDKPDQIPALSYALFVGTAMSITAVPVISKTLMDLGLYRTDFGMVIVASAMLNDLTGWLLFAIVLGSMGMHSGLGLPVSHTILVVITFAGLMLTVGRSIVHRLLPWIQAHMSWPGGVMGFALSMAFFASAFTEAVGVHAVLGAFLVGVAVGDSSHLREQTRRDISHFISFIFAPLFFGAIGLRMNFLTNFNLPLVLSVLVIACLGKLIGCALAARLSGMSPREAWATGIGMNARGTMEIVLGSVALQSKLISEEFFEALVVMALVTAVIPGPAIQFLLDRKRRVSATQFISAKTFIPQLNARNRWEAIHELAQGAAESFSLDFETIHAPVKKREQVMATGMGHGVAVPHGRIENLHKPLIAVGISKNGLDFDAPDGKPVHLVFLVATPLKDNGAQLQIMADISQNCLKPTFIEKASKAQNYTEFLAAVRTL